MRSRTLQVARSHRQLEVLVMVVVVIRPCCVVVYDVYACARRRDVRAPW